MFHILDDMVENYEEYKLVLLRKVIGFSTKSKKDAPHDSDKNYSPVEGFV